MKLQRHHLIVALVLGLFLTNSAYAKGDDFNSVVKMIEQFYGVKHQGIPFLARAGMKVVGTAAKVRGGKYRRFAELGSVKVATFEGQDFQGDFAKFRSTLNAAMVETWTPMIQTLSAEDQEQVYIFVRDSGKKFNVLVVTIEPGDGTVVQATLSAKNLAELMKDPENAGKSLSQEAIADND
jgi:hypothetical protein